MPCPYRRPGGYSFPPLVRGEVAREARRRGNPSVSLAADSSPLTRGAKEIAAPTEGNYYPSGVQGPKPLVVLRGIWDS